MKGRGSLADFFLDSHIDHNINTVTHTTLIFIIIFCPEGYGVVYLVALRVRDVLQLVPDACPELGGVANVESVTSEITIIPIH